MKVTDLTVRVPAGEYYLGDPTFVFDTNMEWLSFIGSFVPKGNVIDIMGTKILAFSVNGDGVYRDNNGRVYVCDSGTIALIPRSYIDYLPAGGQKVVFKRDVSCSIDYLSDVLRFGDIRIIANQLGEE